MSADDVVCHALQHATPLLISLIMPLFVAAPSITVFAAFSPFDVDAVYVMSCALFITLRRCLISLMPLPTAYCFASRYCATLMP